MSTATSPYTKPSLASVTTMGQTNIYHLRQAPTRVQPYRDAVLRAVDAARFAPTDGRPEPWRFYLIGQETAESLAWVAARNVEELEGPTAARREFDRWRAAPGCVVVTCAAHEDADMAALDMEDCCTATQRFVLSLWSEHIDTNWVTAGITESPRFMEVLGAAPDAERIVGVLWYGRRRPEDATPPAPADDVIRHLP